MFSLKKSGPEQSGQFPLRSSARNESVSLLRLYYLARGKDSVSKALVDELRQVAHDTENT
jgi:hypothetical protein